MTFKARVVHATQSTFRIFVTVDVRDPMDPSKLPARSNRLMFVISRHTLLAIRHTCTRLSATEQAIAIHYSLLVGRCPLHAVILL